MAYRIETVTLSSATATTTGPAGLVFTKKDIEDFLDDWRKDLHKEWFILLSKRLADEFEAHDVASMSKLGKSAGGFMMSAAAGSGLGILANAAKLLVNGPGKNFSSDGFDQLEVICAWSRQTPVRFNCGRLGIFVKYTRW